MKKIYYVVYNSKDFPICYADSLDEVGKFAEKSKESIRSIVSRCINGKNKKIIIRGERCTVSKFKEEG